MSAGELSTLLFFAAAAVSVVGLVIGLVTRKRGALDPSVIRMEQQIEGKLKGLPEREKAAGDLREERVANEIETLKRQGGKSK